MAEYLLNMSATVGGLSGTPSSINLHDRTRFELVEWAIPGVTYRLTEIAGDYQPGAILVNAVRDTATLSGVVRVLGTSEANLRTNMRLLFRALGQFSYNLTEVIEGNADTYRRCRPANLDAIGGVDWDITRGLHQQAYQLSIRCHPRTVETP